MTIAALPSLYTEMEELKKYLKGFNNIGRLLTKKEEIELIKSAQAGNIKARNILIKQNIRFIIKIALIYRSSGYGLVDLVSEGILGLNEGIMRFKPSKNIKLTSYSVWWIKQKMTVSIFNTGSTIRIPHNVFNKYLKSKKSHQGDWTKFNDSLKKAHSILNMASLDAPIDEDGYSLKDLVMDTSNDLELSKEDIEIIEKGLNLIEQREKRIIESYFGLNDKERKDLRQIAEIEKLSHERIRQIKDNGLKKITVFAKTVD